MPWAKSTVSINEDLEQHLPSAISSDDSMYDRDVFPPNIVHHNLSDLCILASVPKEKEVSSLECRLHAPR